ncbi:MAG: hypothetical protein KKB51_09375 [Candidatus Riflebacteria bacterium]|nr:hypothetical protein [Candidatus Riflebacteria bacterium]
MITWKFEKTSFDFQDFVKAMFAHFKKVGGKEMTPADFIWRENADVEAPEHPESVTWKSLLEELENGQQIFFPFSEPNVGNPVRCADGNKVKLPESGDDDNDSDEEFCYGETDVVGVLVTLTKSRFEFCPAIYYMGDLTSAPSMEKCPVGQFEDIIAAFLKVFKKEKQMAADGTKPEIRKKDHRL